MRVKPCCLLLDHACRSLIDPSLGNEPYHGKDFFAFRLSRKNVEPQAHFDFLAVNDFIITSRIDVTCAIPASEYCTAKMKKMRA